MFYFFKQGIDDIFLKKYDLSNVLDNDFDTILSRIYFVFNIGILHLCTFLFIFEQIVNNFLIYLWTKKVYYYN